MHCFFLDAINEPGSAAVLSELDIQVNQHPLDPTPPHTHSLTLPVDHLHDLYKERQCVSDAVVYQPQQEGLCVDVRDTADCWLRVCVPLLHSLTLPAGMYHRLHTDASHPISFLTHSLSSSSSEPVMTLRYPYALDNTHTHPLTHTFRELTCELCRQFYECGWVTGTGGSISIRYGTRVYMTPSGVPKERIQPDEVFLLDLTGAILTRPSQKVASKVPKLTDCAPLFFHAYRLRNAGAVIHSHDITCVLASALFPNSTEYRITRQEMIKGIAHHSFTDTLVIPIIENTPHESDLAHSLSEAILQYPKTSAVLVRDHGIYVWGDTWEAAKRHSECLHYLFNASIQMHSLGLRTRTPLQSLPHSCSGCDGDGGDGDSEGATRKRKHVAVAVAGGASTSVSASTTVSVDKRCDVSSAKFVLLDIEGTTTPITFVKDVLFPYSSTHLTQHLTDTLDSPTTQAIITALLDQHQKDAMSHSPGGSVEIKYHSDGKVVIDTVSEYARALIHADRKVPPLKQLQGNIWKKGYACGDLHAVVYEDVKPFLTRMRECDVSVCIYSSGSRGAQQLLFKYTNEGDLRPYLNAYFDTTVGQKQSASSYEDILLTLGCTDTPSDVVFVTDVVGEANAALEAGMRAVVSVRVGNAPLPVDHGFPVITSFDQLQ